jgi:predicted transposase YbfD/YdcC|tara:strand:+ start:30 stop:359 length:330 start_codon:yes stop_codon:yes gene_type:complete
MAWWTKTKNFIIKYWQWILMTITAIAFYILGRSKDAKKQQVEFHEKWKDLEKKKSEDIIEGWEDKNKERHDSMVQNILNFEEKKHKILRDAKKISTEDFLKSKGIEREE